MVINDEEYDNDFRTLATKSLAGPNWDSQSLGGSKTRQAEGGRGTRRKEAMGRGEGQRVKERIKKRNMLMMFSNWI